MTKKQFIMDELFKMGMPANYNGFAYLLDCIELAENDLDNGLVPIVQTYCKVADMHNSTHTRVERNIRFCIDRIWKSGNMEYITSIFHNGYNPLKGRPTNGEFIARMAYHVRMNYQDVISA